MQEVQVQFLGQEDPLEKGMATHSSILAWRILVGYSLWGRKESDMTEWLILSHIILNFWWPAAAAAKSLQSCPTLCDPIDGSPPGSPSLGFSRKEHWSGLPFPPPMQESEKWKWSRSVVSDSSQPCGLQPTRILHPWDFLGKSAGVGCHCLLRFDGLLCIKCHICVCFFKSSWQPCKTGLLFAFLRWGRWGNRG